MLFMLQVKKVSKSLFELFSFGRVFERTGGIIMTVKPGSWYMVPSSIADTADGNPLPGYVRVI
jgi:hypothetical protein